VEDTKNPSACQTTCNARLSPLTRKILSKTFWVISTGRNAIVVIVCLAIAYAFDPVLSEDPHHRNTTFILTGKIEGGLPPFKPPPFNTVLDGESLNFVEMMQKLGGSIIVIPFIAILENVAIAKSFGESCKPRV
jgi:sodium-independent sulfate anion transporter 11